MEFYTLLLLGGLIGMQHALEADHLAAVAALSDKRSSRRALVLRGSAWGLGHTITLLTICGALLLLEETISPHTEAMLEFAVGENECVDTSRSPVEPCSPTRYGLGPREPAARQ